MQLEQLQQASLSNITLNLKHDSLLMVVGKVGAGKTTLLYSIMEENKRLSGDMKVQGRLAYVEQEPFIYSGSIEENVTFGLVYDKDRFKKSIEASCLDSDMQLFPNG